MRRLISYLITAHGESARCPSANQDNRGHLAGGIGRVDDDALSTSDKRRFLLAVGDDYWVGRTHGAVLARIRTDLAQDDAEAITQVQVE